MRPTARVKSAPHLGRVTAALTHRIVVWRHKVNKLAHEGEEDDRVKVCIGDQLHVGS